MVANGRMYESRVESLQSEVNRLTDQLRTEQERANFNEAGKKGLESQIHELTLRLEDLDHSKDSKKIVEKLKNRLHELEAELETEQRRSRDISSEIRKYQKQVHDYKNQYEDEHRLNSDLKDQNHTLLNKLNLLNKQIEEQVCTNFIFLQDKLKNWFLINTLIIFLLNISILLLTGWCIEHHNEQVPQGSGAVGRLGKKGRQGGREQCFSHQTRQYCCGTGSYSSGRFHHGKNAWRFQKYVSQQEH